MRTRVLGPILRCGVLLFLAAVAACAKVESDVVRFNNLGSDVAGKSYFVYASQGQRGSAEFAHYARSITARLDKLGFKPAASLEDADYAVLIAYGVGGAREISGAYPIYGQTSGGTNYHSGTASVMSSSGNATGSYSGTSYTPPTYGVVGSIPYRFTVHKRFFGLRMIDLKKSSPSKLVAAYEARAVSEGTAASFAEVSECIFDSVFQDFLVSGTKGVLIDASKCVRK